MTGAASPAAAAGAGGGASPGAAALASNERRSASSCSSASGRPSASFALRTASPTLPGTRSSAAWARARIESNIPIVLVNDAEALAASRNRRRRLVVRIDLGGDRHDAVLLARLRGRVLRDREQLDVRFLVLL